MLPEDTSPAEPGTYLPAFIRLDSMQHNMMTPDQWLARLVQIPSVTPLHAGPRAGQAGEGRIAAQLAQWFGALGAEVILEDAHPNRPNVYATWRNPSSDRWIALDCHTDTVGVEQMPGDPFSGEARAGRVWGRGAVDDKASLAVALSVLQGMQTAGARPAANLIVAAVADEEVALGGAFVFDAWLRARGLRLDELVVAEPTLCAPCFGHMGSARIDFTVQGVSTHTSQPHLGKNAIVGAARIVLAMQAEHERLQTIAATPVGKGQLSAIQIGGGRAPNIVPDLATLGFNRRVTSDEDEQAVMAGLAQLGKDAAGLPTEAEIFRPMSAFLQDPNSAMVRQFSAWSGQAPVTVPYCSDASAYRSDTVKNILVMGPGSIDQAHGAEEWVEISELERMAGVYRQWWTK